MTMHFARLPSPITMTAMSTQKDITTVANLSLKTKLRRPKRGPDRVRWQGSPLLPLALSQHRIHDPHGT